VQVHQNGGPIHDVMQDCILLVGSSTPIHLHAQIRTGRLPDMFFLWRTKICLGIICISLCVAWVHSNPMSLYFAARLQLAV